MRIFNSIFLGLIWFYQKFLSRLKPACCRFTPTCSEYARQAYGRFNVFYATWLTLWRILRCNPFNHGPAYDPVPESRDDSNTEDAN